MFTILVNIVALNLLIAIISNTYDNVQASLDAHHTRTKIDILNEIQQFMTNNRHRNELSFIHFIHYANEKLSATQGDGDEWVGRVRLLMNELKDVRVACKSIQSQNNKLTYEQN